MLRSLTYLIPIAILFLIVGYWPHNEARGISSLFLFFAAITAFFREYVPKLIWGESTGSALYYFFIALAILFSFDPIFAIFGINITDVISKLGNVLNRA